MKKISIFLFSGFLCTALLFSSCTRKEKTVTGGALGYSKVEDKKDKKKKKKKHDHVDVMMK